MDKNKRMKLEEYAQLNRYVKKGETVFAGSSLCQLFPLNELAMSFDVKTVLYNRGVSGFVCSELLQALGTCILDLEPRRLFINIGTNDLSQPGYTVEGLLASYSELLRRVRATLPKIEITMLAFYPMNTTGDFGLPPQDKAAMFSQRTNAAIHAANTALEQFAAQNGCRWLNLNDPLLDANGELKAEYSIEGMHMWPAAYAQILQQLAGYL